MPRLTVVGSMPTMYEEIVMLLQIRSKTDEEKRRLAQLEDEHASEVDAARTALKDAKESAHK